MGLSIVSMGARVVPIVMVEKSTGILLGCFEKSSEAIQTYIYESMNRKGERNPKNCLEDILRM